jgi:hypothetical protein
VSVAEIEIAIDTDRGLNSNRNNLTRGLLVYKETSSRRRGFVIPDDTVSRCVLQDGKLKSTDDNWIESCAAVKIIRAVFIEDSYLRDGRNSRINTANFLIPTANTFSLRH